MEPMATVRLIENINNPVIAGWAAAFPNWHQDLSVLPRFAATHILISCSTGLGIFTNARSQRLTVIVCTPSRSASAACDSPKASLLLLSSAGVMVQYKHIAYAGVNPGNVLGHRSLGEPDVFPFLARLDLARACEFVHVARLESQPFRYLSGRQQPRGCGFGICQRVRLVLLLNTHQVFPGL